MDAETIHHFRFIPVVILLGVAAALLRHRGEPPLALRGLQKILGGKPATVTPVPLWRRILAFVCVIAALLLAIV